MQPHATIADAVPRRHRPRTLTVFAAAFAAGAVLAYGIDRVVDVHAVQVQPQVESEPIFVALRALPQGSPVTVWDVALKDWPKAMLPSTALKADATFEGLVLRHPIREGQPLLSVQLVRDSAPAAATVAVLPPTANAWIPAVPAAPDAGPAGAATSPPATADRFVPALSAPPPAVSATEVSAIEVQASPAAADPVTIAAAAATPAAAEPRPAAPVIADTDIDAAFVSQPPASATEPASQPGPAVVADVDLAPAVDAAPLDPPATLPVMPTPEPTPADMPRQVATVGDPEAPLVAPVPSLPTTDIERSLSRFGRQRPEPAAQAPSVLDRSSDLPPPRPAPTSPRHHLVVPERIALAADASFTQRPAAATPADAAARVAVAPAATMPRGQAASAPPSRQPVATKPAGSGTTGRSASRSPSAARQPAGRPTAKSHAKPSDPPQSAPARKLGAWFSPFSGDTQQR